MSESAVRPASADDRRAAATSLAEAFSTDPLFEWLVGSPNLPPKRLFPMFNALLRPVLRRDGHLVFVSGSCEGVAIWNDVDDWETSTLAMLPSVPALIRSLGRGLGRGYAIAQAMDRAHPQEPHFYLDVLGVAPDQQGSGYGSAVLSPMLGRCDEEGVAGYLVNSNPANTAFYRRHGFADRGLIQAPEGCPPLQAMWREPR